MKGNLPQQAQTPPPKKPGMSDFRKALLWTAVPLVALGLVSFGARASVRFLGLGFPLSFSFVGVLFLWLLALFTATGFAIAGRRRIAAGIFAGAGIGLVGVGLTCFGP